MKILRRILPFLGIAIAIGLLYDGWIFYSRWSGARQAERDKMQQETVLARKTLKLLGGAALKINSFYCSPAAIPKGSRANICYGVVGAKTVRLEPPVEEVWPALNRCLQVSPARDTEYKLIAEDAAGHSVSESFVLRVHP
ncbi:MAG: hypothetical protein ABUS51_05115 [Acidobacteriota bacterium]